MGVCLDKPMTEKTLEQGHGNGLKYGVAAMQGWRVEMEDTYSALAKLIEAGLEGWSFFGVFDGHAGGDAAIHVAENLPNCILQSEEFRNGDISGALREGFLRLDERMRTQPSVARGCSGCTAVCALIAPDYVYLANCGDSRAVLCRNGEAVFSTRDHKPALPEERERIQRAGGSVIISRVNGSLAVSRALGDYVYKSRRELGPTEQLVSPEPDVTCWERSSEDEFLLLACDGVWDVLSNEDACAYVRALLSVTPNIQEVCARLIDACLAKGSYDNMSVVLVTFPGAPRPCPEAQARDRQLDDTLKRKLTELVSLGVDSAAALRTELGDLPDLLPGAGIHDKWQLIQKYLNELGVSEGEEEQATPQGSGPDSETSEEGSSRQ